MQQSFRGSQSNFSAEGISGQTRASALVLDTNVALDLLVFRDPACVALAGLLERAALRWYAVAAMRAEFDDVLGRPAFERWAGQREPIAAQWARWAVMIESAPLVRAPCAMRCADPDDQMFLDLAFALRPCCLLSRDRELLRLAERASTLGIRIVTPTQFNAP